MTKPDTLLGAVADAIATADVDGATYEDLAVAACLAHSGWRKRTNSSGWSELRDHAKHADCNNDQEDDGA